jgi:hypothetical protein
MYMRSFVLLLLTTSPSSFGFSVHFSRAFMKTLKLNWFKSSILRNQGKLTLDAIHKLSRYFRRLIDLGHLSNSQEFGWRRLDFGPPFDSFEVEKIFLAVSNCVWQRLRHFARTYSMSNSNSNFFCRLLNVPPIRVSLHKWGDMSWHYRKF